MTQPTGKAVTSSNSLSPEPRQASTLTRDGPARVVLVGVDFGKSKSFDATLDELALLAECNRPWPLVAPGSPV